MSYDGATAVSRGMKGFDPDNTNTPPEVEDLATGSCTDLAYEDKRFYVHLMAKQLLHKTKPLHLRRTLDQWYYSTTCDTSQVRDSDQIVSKFGPEKKKKGSRAVLVVDQLWLWLLGDGKCLPQTLANSLMRY